MPFSEREAVGLGTDHSFIQNLHNLPTQDIPLMECFRHDSRMSENSWIKRTGSFVVDKAGDVIVGLVLAGTFTLASATTAYLWWQEKLALLWPVLDWFRLVIASPYTWVVAAFLVGYIVKGLVIYLSKNSKGNKDKILNKKIDAVILKLTAHCNDLDFRMQHRGLNTASDISIQSKAYLAFDALQDLGLGRPVIQDFPDPSSYQEQLNFIEAILPFLKERKLETVKSIIEQTH